LWLSKPIVVVNCKKMTDANKRWSIFFQWVAPIKVEPKTVLNNTNEHRDGPGQDLGPTWPWEGSRFLKIKPKNLTWNLLRISRAKNLAQKMISWQKKFCPWAPLYWMYYWALSNIGQSLCCPTSATAACTSQNPAKKMYRSTAFKGRDCFSKLNSLSLLKNYRYLRKHVCTVYKYIFCEK